MKELQLKCRIYSAKIPRALAIELTKIAARNHGAIHLIMNENIFSDLNVPSVSFTSSTIVFGFMIKPTNRQVRIATIGIRILLLMKSIISRIDIPPREMCFSLPNPREEGMPSAKEKAVTIRLDAVRFR